MPGPAARQEQRPGRVLAEPAREQRRRRRRWPTTRSSTSSGSGNSSSSIAVERRVALGQADRDAVVATRSSGPRARAAPGAAPRCASDHGAWTRPPNGVRMHEPPVAELVAEALDDDPPVGRAGRPSPRARPRGRRAGSRRRSSSRSWRLAERASAAVARPFAPRARSASTSPTKAPSARPSSIGRPTASPCQNGSLPGTPGRRADGHPVVADLLDPPAARAEHDDVAVHPGPQLVDHLLVELADAPAGRPGLARQEHAEQAAVRDRAAAGDGDDPGVAPALDDVGDAVPDDARLELGELVRRVGAGEHARGRPRGPRGSASRTARRAVTSVEQLVDGPAVHRRSSRRAAGRGRRAGCAGCAVVSIAPSCIRRDDDRGLEQVAAVLREDDALARARRPGARPGRRAGARGRRCVGLSTWMTRSTAPMSMPSSRLSSWRRARGGGRP